MRYAPYIILGLIVLCLTLIAIQTTFTGNAITGNQVAPDGFTRQAFDSTTSNPIMDPVLQLFTDWTKGGGVAPNSAKLLFLILLSLLIWSILDTSHLFGRQGWVQVFIAIIIAFLSTVYIAPGDIWVILTSYNALGTTLLTMIPFGILALFTYRAVSDNSAGMITIQRIVWGLFALYLVASFISGYRQERLLPTSGYGIVYIIATIGATIAFISNKTLIHQLAVMQTDAAKEVAKRNLSTIETGLAGMRDVGNTLGGGQYPGP